MIKKRRTVLEKARMNATFASSKPEMQLSVCVVTCFGKALAKHLRHDCYNFMVCKFFRQLAMYP